MRLTDYPIVSAVTYLILLWLAARAGARLRRRSVTQAAGEESELGVIVGASLTLFGLLIGFAFSMAVSRYDQRKSYEEEEANAIGTEYVRAGLLQTADATRVRALLNSYLDQRILFYTTRTTEQLDRVTVATAKLQNELWAAIQGPAVAQPNAVNALVVAGMNDVLNRQGYTQAAYWNRIPRAAWILMLAIGVGCNILFGYNSREPESKSRHLLILPSIMAIAFFLVADIESPRHGIVRVPPQNLLSLAASLP